MDPGDGLQKFDVWGREAGEARRGELGSERAASQPSKRWITGDRVLRLAPTSVFAWLNCGVASHSSQSVLGDPGANLAAREHASRYRNRPPVCLGCRISSTRPVAGDRRLQRMLAGRGRGSRRSGGLKEVQSWLTRNGACKQYTTSRRDEASKAGGNRERRLAWARRMGQIDWHGGRWQVQREPSCLTGRLHLHII